MVDKDVHMQWEHPKKDNKKDKKEEECNCCIEIKDSFVLIICSEIDPKQLRDSLKTFIEIKGNTNVVSQEQE